jgi:16S rRNA (cytidine1402-2'-O)-methyltransferase
LLSHYGISTRQTALHDHNEAEAAGGIIQRLQKGESVALVSDAGTPLVSDPGFQLVRRAHEAGIRVSPIPGPSAAIAGLSVSGLPTDRFSFEGFLPAKREARKKKLAELSDDTRTLIFFESVHRIGDAIRDMSAVLGDRPAFIGRELSKLFEQCLNTSLEELVKKIEAGEVVAKGEFVIVVSGAEETPSDQAMIKADELLAELMQQLPGSQAVDIVSKLGGEKRNDVYKKMLALKD